MKEISNKKYMFFWGLPISFNCLDAPLYLSPHVYVNKNAQEVICKIQHIEPAIANAIYPQYGIPGFGCQHRLLCADLNSVNSKQARKEMWEILGLLRLLKPLPLHIAGTVDITDDGIKSFETLWRQTYLNIPAQVNIEYDLSDLQNVQILWNIFFGYQQGKQGRLKKALDSFIRTTLTEQISFQETFFQKLFPILDLLCGNPPSHHAREIQSNIGSWLQHIYSQEILKPKIDFPKVLGSIWESYRIHYLHESYSALPASHLYFEKKDGSFYYAGVNPDADSMAAVMALHEIIRLCLLSLLFLPEEQRYNFDTLLQLKLIKPRINEGRLIPKEEMPYAPIFKI